MQQPHGGTLINRVAKEGEGRAILKELSEKGFYRLELSREQAVDVENIAFGVHSPLTGFMGRREVEGVIANARLGDDTPWTLPIVLWISRADLAQAVEASGGSLLGSPLLLSYQENNFAALRVSDAGEFDKATYAKGVFGTTEMEHPGVRRLYEEEGEVLLAGEITLLKELDAPFRRYKLRPLETRLLFQEWGWKTVVGFQTRNVPHLGHEYVQKTALTFVDGILVNPVLGRKKPGDFRDEVIIEAYQELLSHYYLRDNSVLAALEYEMRYAGPREAVHHAIMRKNFGCTHFVVGRDHAGVGDYYGMYEAQEYFKQFPDLGITPLPFKSFFYCRRCGGVVNDRICPHDPKEQVNFSGSRIRAALQDGNGDLDGLMRPEVVKVLQGRSDLFVEKE